MNWIAEAVPPNKQLPATRLSRGFVEDRPASERREVLGRGCDVPRHAARSATAVSIGAGQRSLTVIRCDGK